MLVNFNQESKFVLEYKNRILSVSMNVIQVYKNNCIIVSK